MARRQAKAVPKVGGEIFGRTPTYGWESGLRTQALGFVVKRIDSQTWLTQWQPARPGKQAFHFALFGGRRPR